MLLAGFHHRLILRDNLSQSPSGGWQPPPFIVSKGGLPTATTYFKKHKISKGETVAQSLKERFDYGQNPDKTEGGELISSYGCDHMTADAEFLLSKAKYKAATGREQRRDADVLCYQIRQSFKPGEITPEEANRIGYETAMRWTKGKYAFFVATHTDKAHIHNHIYYNSTSLDCTRKFRDFIGSAVRCGGFLTAFALKMICPSSPIPSCTARGDFSITGRGWGQRGSPHTRSSCGLPSMKLLQNAPPTLTLSSGSWRRPASRSSMGAAERSLFLFRDRSGRPGCGHPPSGTATIPRTSRLSLPGSARSRSSLFLCLLPLVVSI